MSHRARTWCDTVTAPSAMAKHILSALCDMANIERDAPPDSPESCWPSVGHLVRVTQWKDRAIRKALKDLEGAGLIHAEPRWSENGRAQSNVYWLAMPSDFGTTAHRPNKNYPARETGTAAQSAGDLPCGAGDLPCGAGTTLSDMQPLNLNNNRKEPLARDANGPSQASQRRDARWPASNGKGPSSSGPAAAAADRSGNGTVGAGQVRTKAQMRREADDLALELGVIGPGTPAYDAWAALILEVHKRGEANAARAWLCRRNVTRLDWDGGLTCTIVAANALAYQKIGEVFGGLLAERRWRVAVSGAGG